MNSKMLDLLIAIGSNFNPTSGVESCILGGWSRMQKLTQNNVDCLEFPGCQDCIFCSSTVSKVKEMQGVLKTMELLDE